VETLGGGRNKCESAPLRDDCVYSNEFPCCSTLFSLRASACFLVMQTTQQEEGGVLKATLVGAPQIRLFKAAVTFLAKLGAQSERRARTPRAGPPRSQPSFTPPPTLSLSLSLHPHSQAPNSWSKPSRTVSSCARTPPPRRPRARSPSPPPLIWPGRPFFLLTTSSTQPP